MSDDSFEYGGENGDSFEFSREDGSNGDSSEGDSGEKDFSDEESPKENYKGEDAEEGLNFGETFSDIQRTGQGSIKEGGGFFKGTKSARSIEQAASEKAQGILSGEDMYSNVKEGEKDKILSMISRIENIDRCSIEVLIPALLFKVRRLELQKDFQSFYKKLEGIEAEDLLRYIRQYSSLK
jgi:hypothetical protein